MVSKREERRQRCWQCKREMSGTFALQMNKHERRGHRGSPLGVAAAGRGGHAEAQRRRRA